MVVVIAFVIVVVLIAITVVAIVVVIWLELWWNSHVNESIFDVGVASYNELNESHANDHGDNIHDTAMVTVLMLNNGDDDQVYVISWWWTSVVGTINRAGGGERGPFLHVPGVAEARTTGAGSWSYSSAVPTGCHIRRITLICNLDWTIEVGGRN